MREVILQLPDAMYERLAATAASHDMLAAALDALGFECLEPEKANRLSALLKSRKERAVT